MKQTSEMQVGRSRDTALNWTMRAVGIIVFAASAFFLFKDFTLSPLYDYFFAMTALFGLVTTAASWLEPIQRPAWNREPHPQLEIVRQRSS